ncbi:MAG: triose-phosphate isomerase [Oligoflexales bacterium]
MRNKLIAANWKMNKRAGDVQGYFHSFLNESNSKGSSVDVLFAVPFPLIERSAAAVKGSGVAIAAQNMHFAKSGAYTGEVSAEMVKDAGASHVIIGHSERRQYFAETDEVVAEKVKSAFAQGLLPVLCVGETLEQRKSGVTNSIVSKQLETVFAKLESFDKGIIAYEPVWAIGTGLNATAKEAEAVHAMIRTVVAKFFGDKAAQKIQILYGGSANASNLEQLLRKPNIDGGLVGGASLDPTTFAQMIRIAGQLSQ